MKDQFTKFVVGAFIFAPTFLLGCSTYSKRQCQEMDWYREGRKSALNGDIPKQAKTFFIDKCQVDHGVAVEYVSFERGFASGLDQLCSPESLEARAAQGLKYPPACESHEDARVLQKTKVTELQDRIKELEAEVARLKAENAKLTAEAPPKTD